MPRSKPKLTKRDIEIIKLVCKGLPNRDIANKLNIGEHTVRLHLKFIFKILDVRGRIDLARNWYCELYLIGCRELGII